MTAVVPVLLLALLLLFPEASVHGASDGLLLWYRVVLPSLLPFLICTRVIADRGGFSLLMRPAAPLFGRVFGLSPDGAYVLLCGLLCGYPLGAKLCADFSAEGRICPREARALLAVCNHPSPMFLTGYLRGLLPLPVSAAVLFFCLYAPVLPLSLLARRVYGSDGTADGRKQEESAPLPRIQQPFGSILLSGCETMVLIGCTMMLFSILSEWILLLPGCGPRTQALLSGLAEITTGSRRICRVFPGRTALPAVLALAAFGGLSGLSQTQAVLRQNTQAGNRPDTENAGLSARHYVLWKLLHAALTASLAVLYLSAAPAAHLTAAALLRPAPAPPA